MYAYIILHTLHIFINKHIYVYKHRIITLKYLNIYIYSIRNSRACIAICYSKLSWLLFKIEFG